MLLLFSNLNCYKGIACIPTTWAIILCFYHVVGDTKRKRKKQQNLMLILKEIKELCSPIRYSKYIWNAITWSVL